jgi:hypothetical protein
VKLGKLLAKGRFRPIVKTDEQGKRWVVGFERKSKSSRKAGQKMMLRKLIPADPPPRQVVEVSTAGVHGAEPGATCNRPTPAGPCPGVIRYSEAEGCTCTAGTAPCAACASIKPVCPACGWCWGEDET